MKEAKKEKNITTISQHTDFLEGVYDMKLFQLRTFISLLSKHKNGFPVFKDSIPFTMADLGIPMPKSTFYDNIGRVKDLADDLAKVTFRYETEGTYEPLHIFVPVVDKKTGELRVKLSVEIQELVNIWTKKFTVADVETLLAIPNFTSYRIYMLLKRFQNFKDERTIPLDKLRSMLCLNQKSYDLYGNIKNRILNPAKEHLKNTDMKFEFEEVKTGKAVSAVTFKFKQVPRTIEVKDAPKKKTSKNAERRTGTTTSIGSIVSKVQKKISKKTVDDIMAEYNLDVATMGVQVVQDRVLEICDEHIKDGWYLENQVLYKDGIPSI